MNVPSLLDRIRYLESVLSEHEIPIVSYENKLPVYATSKQLRNPTKHELEIAPLIGKSAVKHRILKAFDAQQLTRFNAAEIGLCDPQTAARYLLQFYKLGKIYIVGYVRSRGCQIPIYAWGKGRDAAKLPPMSGEHRISSRKLLGTQVAYREKNGVWPDLVSKL